MNKKLSIGKDLLKLGQNSCYCVQLFAEQSRMSVRQLERYFLQHFDQTPQAWLHALRMRHAVELLRDGSNIKETAARLGYYDASHFSRDFKKHFGQSPAHHARPNFEAQS